MSNISKIQTGLWLAFLIYFTAAKYLAAFSGWNLAYAIQVGIIVVLTALIPFYATKWLANLTPIAKLFKIIMPSLLAVAGYTGFFFVFIQPNFPEATLAAVAVRGLFPGLVISFILLLPEITEAIRDRKAEQ